MEPADIFGELIGIAAGVIIGEDDESEVAAQQSPAALSLCI